MKRPRRSSLKRIIPMHIALGIAASSLIPMITVSIMLYSIFSDYEVRNLNGRRDQFRILMGRENSALQSITKSYAEWNDSYEYMAVREGDYPEDNYGAGWLASQNIDMVFIVAPNGELLWSNIDAVNYDRATGMPIPPMEYSLLFPTDYGSLPPSPVAGFLDFNDTPALYTSWPITDDYCTLPPRGLLVFLRLLTEDLLAAFSPGEGFSVSYLSEGSLDVDIRSGDPFIDSESGKELIACDPVKDPLGIPLGHWIYRQDRTLIRAVKSLIAWFLTIGFIVGFGAYTMASIIVSRRMVYPILSIRDHLDHFSETFAADALLKVRHADEIGDLAKHVNNLIERVEGQTTELERLAGTDGLTGLPNRRRLDAALASLEFRSRVGKQKAEERKSSKKGIIACGLMDVDFFKKYNDRYGHVEGDEALRQIAAAVLGGAKRPGDLPCRYGGEEFAVLLPDTDEAGAVAVLERIRAAVEAFGIIHRGSKAAPVITISAGAAAITSVNEDTSLVTLFNMADKALYAAKAAGRNRVVAFSSIDTGNG